MRVFRAFQDEIVRDSYHILYVLRKSKKDPNRGTIYARLTFNKQVITLCSLGIEVNYLDFNSKKQETQDDFINNKLALFRADIFRLIEITPNPTALKIRDIVMGRSTPNPTITSILKMYMGSNSEEYAPGTEKDWKVKINKLEIYLKATKQEYMEARQFGIVAFNRFKTWLINEQDNTENSANRYGMKFRKALRWAVQQGHIKENPLRDCDLKVSYDFNLTHLDWSIVERLRRYPFEGKLKKAVDMYVFSCATGICYADMLNLSDKNIENNSKFGLIITNKRQKVNSVYSTPLWGFAKEIYEEHGGLDNIPKISNQRANDYIKIALHKIGYSEAENITFHSGRKTFVNYCLNNKLIEPHIIATFTGHQNVDEIKAYGKVKRDTAISVFYNV